MDDGFNNKYDIAIEDSGDIFTAGGCDVPGLYEVTFRPAIGGGSGGLYESFAQLLLCCYQASHQSGMGNKHFGMAWDARLDDDNLMSLDMNTKTFKFNNAGKYRMRVDTSATFTNFAQIKLMKESHALNIVEVDATRVIKVAGNYLANVSSGDRVVIGGDYDHLVDSVSYVAPNTEITIDGSTTAGPGDTLYLFSMYNASRIGRTNSGGAHYISTNIEMVSYFDLSPSAVGKKFMVWMVQEGDGLVWWGGWRPVDTANTPPFLGPRYYHLLELWKEND